MRRAFCLLAVVGAVLAVAPSSASAHFFTCRASALRVDVRNALTNLFAEPEVANQPGGNTLAFYDPDPQCASDVRQVAGVVIPGSPPPIFAALAVSARTIFTPCATPCSSATPARASASNADVLVSLPGLSITATALSAQAAASCNTQSKEGLSGASSVLGLTINGQGFSINGPATIPINNLVTVYLNRQITGTASDGDRFLTQRALEVVSPALGADIVAGEATADFSGTPCLLP
jgi:hypothetical protein